MEGGTEPTIPVLVDSEKRFDHRSILRSFFFWIEIDEDAIVDIESPLPLIDAAFMLGRRAIVTAPSSDQPHFDSPESIDRLFTEVEREETRRIVTGTVWFPVLGDLDPEREGRRGSVFRIPLRLFLASCAFAAQEIDPDELYDRWGDNQVQALHSEGESEAFRGWMEMQVLESRRQYEDEERSESKLPRKQLELEA